MEEKIYKNQVSKQAMAARVVDAQTPDNQFTAGEKAELMKFHDADDDKNNNSNNSGNSNNITAAIENLGDEALIEFVKHYQSIIVSIEDQGSLLADNKD